MRHLILITILLLSSVANTFAQKKPRLVVNIVVSQMRYDYLSRFGKNLSEGGFKRIMRDGISFTDSRYNFMQTTTPATLATLTTGADPSTHGIISERWIDYTTNFTVPLIDDATVSGLDCDAGIGRYSPKNITVPTLGDRLREDNRKSKVMTIAYSPTSAIVLGGMSSDVYWIDDTRGSWVSSTAYMKQLPQWVKSYNQMRIASQYIDYTWNMSRQRNLYINTVYSAINVGDTRASRIKSKALSRNYQGIGTTPVGNTLVAEFAKQAIIYEELGKDENVDLLNICFDASRNISETYGGESMEVEDMFYRLDTELSSLLTFISSQLNMEDVVVVVTADHGASDSYDYGHNPREMFNSAQFKVIVNGFMNAQYGSGEWVIDYCDRQLYLNRNLIYTKGLSLEEVQNRVAAFVLQFRGVSHVLTSTAMQTSYFSGSYAEKMQNSFYPKRSGDLTINLMPGWIEERDGRRVASGSMYEYDVHVPLMILGHGFHGQTVSRTVDMRDVAPTLARVMNISRPIASEGALIEEVVRQY
jgi:predicted AlkP superfamily pyrophosphatase or phosphodiesterase